jgi:hypothetical protein
VTASDRAEVYAEDLAPRRTTLLNVADVPGLVIRDTIQGRDHALVAMQMAPPTAGLNGATPSTRTPTRRELLRPYVIPALLVILQSVEKPRRGRG